MLKRLFKTIKTIKVILFSFGSCYLVILSLLVADSLYESDVPANEASMNSQRVNKRPTPTKENNHLKSTPKRGGTTFTETYVTHLKRRKLSKPL
jgi:hypothetical protein